MGRRAGDEQVQIPEILRRADPEVMVADVPAADHREGVVHEESTTKASYRPAENRL